MTFAYRLGQRIVVIVTITFIARTIMDITLLKTFIEVARLRHFGHAADRLFVTQSAVSARVKLLESTLGLELFSRKRNDIRLTPAGKRLLNHAETIVRGWERARQELALEPEISSLAVGFSFDLWDALVRDWAAYVRGGEEPVALQLEMHALAVLSERVAAGTLDIAFLYEPPQASGIEIQKVSEVTLRLFSSVRDTTLDDAFDENYILVDWGLNFGLRHAAFFGERPAPRLRAGTGAMARDLLLLQGGAAYLSEQSVQDDLEQGRLHAVVDAPVINRPVFAIFRSGREDEGQLQALLSAIG